jgi:hypothetical protein
MIRRQRADERSVQFVQNRDRMGIFRKCRQAANENSWEGESEFRLTEVAGPLPFSTAFALARLRIDEIDAEAFFTLATSGHLDAKGRSPIWELFFALPTVLARAELDVHAASEGDHAEFGPDRIVQRVTSVLEKGTILNQLWESAGRDERELLAGQIREQFSNTEALPRDFVDSPAAVTACISRGANIVSSSSDLTLVAKRELGDAVWELRVGSRLFTVPFEEK